MNPPKECWYCHKNTMEEDARGARCSECGATWSPPVTMKCISLEMTEGQKATREAISDRMGSKRLPRMHPGLSGSLVNSAEIKS